MSSGGELDGSASPLDRDSDPLDASESGSSGMVIRLRRLGDDGLTVVENAASMQQHALQSVKRQRTSESESQASAATGKFEYFVPSPQPSRNAVLHLGTGEAVDQWDHFPYSGPLLVGIKPEAPQFPMVVPSYSTWFSLDKVHPNEIRALPEFFPKDAEKYKVRTRVHALWRIE